MKTVKKVLNIEYNLKSDDFIATQQDAVSDKYQKQHPDQLVKVTTYCVPDHQIVVHTTEANRTMMGAGNKMLAKRLLADQSILTLDDEMLKTYEITITKDTDLPDYVTALGVAQAKADEMFEEDDSKIPLVTVIDYRWGNAPATVSASLFTEEDENGNKVGLIGTKDATTNNVVGDIQIGKDYLSPKPILFNDITVNNLTSIEFDLTITNNRYPLYLLGTSNNNNNGDRFYIQHVGGEKYGFGLGDRKYSTPSEDMFILTGILDGNKHHLRIEREIRDDGTYYNVIWDSSKVSSKKLIGKIVNNSVGILEEHKGNTYSGRPAGAIAENIIVKK